MTRPPLGVYVGLSSITAVYGGLLAAVVWGGLWVPAAAEPRALTAPITALVGLTAVVWVMMFAFRNVAVARGVASIHYYQCYASADAPPEWIERPARTFMNLLEVPVLFYVVCLLMLAAGGFDRVQLTLAWIYVVTRLIHAVLYIAHNYVPTRMTAYICSCITLAVMWIRFAGS